MSGDDTTLEDLRRRLNDIDRRLLGYHPRFGLDEGLEKTLTWYRQTYGPRPGDFEVVRKMGLEKWVERQLHAESIDDSALDERLTRYPTLGMSSKKLLEEFPQPQQVQDRPMTERCARPTTTLRSRSH